MIEIVPRAGKGEDMQQHIRWAVGLVFMAGCGGAAPTQTPSSPTSDEPVAAVEQPKPSGPPPQVVADADVDGLLAMLESGGSSGPSATPTPTPPARTPVALPESAPSDWRPGTFMTSALDDLTKRALKAQESTPLGFDGDAATFMGAFLTGGKFVKFSRKFEPGITYAFLGGSSGATDIDIVVRDPSGNIVAGDVDKDATPIVKFKTDTGGVFHVFLHLAKESPAAFVSLGVMREKGLSIPASRIKESVYGAVAKAAKLSAGVKERKMGDGLRFHAGDDWALYGTVMSQGEAIRFGGLDLDTKHIVLGSGDSATTDINLSLLDDSGRPVASDMEPDPLPVLGFNSPGGVYTLKVDCVGATGKTLVTAVVLTVE